MPKEVTLAEALADMEKQMDMTVVEMRAKGLPEASILFTDAVLRPAFASIIAVHATKTPVEDVDDAIVATISSIVLEYVRRVHPKHTGLNAAVEHVQLIVDDFSGRISGGIASSFTKKLLRN